MARYSLQVLVVFIAHGLWVGCQSDNVGSERTDHDTSNVGPSDDTSVLDNDGSEGDTDNLCTDDSDGDGTSDCDDRCPSDANKTTAGKCGCNVPETDNDGDGTPDCRDHCPNDVNKATVGLCGCGIEEGQCTRACEDTSGFVDADGYPCVAWFFEEANCNAVLMEGYTLDQEIELMTQCPMSCRLCDGCPSNDEKEHPGWCGCDAPVSDETVDVDNDGVIDCVDDCMSDGTDSDGDGVENCTDHCPDDATKTVFGFCGCGIPETDCPTKVCADSSDFVDAQGYPCAEWDGYDCLLADDDWGYSGWQEKDIVENCPLTCNLCVP